MEGTLPEIDVEDLSDLLDQGSATLIDCRQPDEYEQVRVAGSRLIPMAEIAERVDEIPRDQGRVYVICATGSRSARVAEFYRAQGIDAVNVYGGTVAWMNAGLPVDSGPAS